MNQSESLTITWKKSIAFGFASHWLKSWHEILKPITALQSQSRNYFGQSFENCYMRESLFSKLTLISINSSIADQPFKEWALGIETTTFYRFFPELCKLLKSTKLQSFNLKCHYDENHIFSIEAILKHKQVACMRIKMLFTTNDKLQPDACRTREASPSPTSHYIFNPYLPSWQLFSAKWSSRSSFKTASLQRGHWMNFPLESHSVKRCSFAPDISTTWGTGDLESQVSRCK